MTPHARDSAVWVVVKVESGIPMSVQVYSDKQKAEAREAELRVGMDPDCDETGLFYVQVDEAESRHHPVSQSTGSRS